MTDPTPNNLPMPTPLSPAAQAVLDAWDAKLNPMVTCLTHDPEREALAAALRAAADQLINVEWSVEMWELHQEFHAIATELEGQS